MVSNKMPDLETFGKMFMTIVGEKGRLKRRNKSNDVPDFGRRIELCDEIMDGINRIRSKIYDADKLEYTPRYEHDFEHQAFMKEARSPDGQGTLEYTRRLLKDAQDASDTESKAIIGRIIQQVDQLAGQSEDDYHDEVES
ncbi:MAG: hypothetical protein MPI93_05700 [Nitrosopumilus sp.]|nr:hypothetical protein [Nitrosopumilus sp.]